MEAEATKKIKGKMQPARTKRGEYLQTLMRIRRISPKELSRRTGILTSSLSQYMHGYSRPCARNALKLALFFRVSPMDIIEGGEVLKRVLPATKDDIVICARVRPHIYAHLKSMKEKSRSTIAAITSTIVTDYVSRDLEDRLKLELQEMRHERKKKEERQK